MTWQIIQSDVIDWAKAYDGPPFHALLCDPPYHLTSITKRFSNVSLDDDSKTSERGRERADGYARFTTGFMGQRWDGGDIAFDPATWAALTEHLYPGAFGMAFASSRGWHRLAVAIEDAGLIIHPSIFLGWCYATGFPKATRINTGEWRETGETEHLSDIRSGAMHACRDTSKVYERARREPAGQAAAFSGHRYGLQTLKPAIEPIIVFQKPYEGRPVDCITRTGAGTLNIDGGRIATMEMGNPREFKERINQENWRITGGRKGSGATHPGGRWPANLIIQHHPDCNEDVCHPDCPARTLDEQSGILKSGTGSTKQASAKGYRPTVFGAESRPEGTPNVEYGDEGPASRYFFQADWSYDVYEQLAGAAPIRYQPKPGRPERDAGLDDLPRQSRPRVNSGGLENEPRWAPVEVYNYHPTVKSISLTKYLSTLLLPPSEYAPRRILVPFAGSGSEAIGAILTGFEIVLGIEQEEDYCHLARERLTWWAEWLKHGQADVETILRAAKQDRDVVESGQRRLF